MFRSGVVPDRVCHMASPGMIDGEVRLRSEQMTDQRMRNVCLWFDSAVGDDWNL